MQSRLQMFEQVEINPIHVNECMKMSMKCELWNILNLVGKLKWIPRNMRCQCLKHKHLTLGYQIIDFRLF